MVPEPHLKYYCGISGFVEISNWHTTYSSLEYSNFPLLKITEKCRYYKKKKHLKAQCEANLSKKSRIIISLNGGELKSCKLRNISEHGNIAGTDNIVEKFKVYKKDIFILCL